MTTEQNPRERVAALARRPEPLSAAELLALTRTERVLYVIARFGPTQEQLAKKMGLERTVVNKIANGRTRVGPAYAERLAVVSGYEPELFRSPRTAAEAEQEALAVVHGAIREVGALRGEVADLRDEVERLAQKVG